MKPIITFPQVLSSIISINPCLFFAIFLPKFLVFAVRNYFRNERVKHLYCTSFWEFTQTTGFISADIHAGTHRPARIGCHREFFAPLGGLAVSLRHSRLNIDCGDCRHGSETTNASTIEKRTRRRVKLDNNCEIQWITTNELKVMLRNLITLVCCLKKLLKQVKKNCYEIQWIATNEFQLMFLLRNLMASVWRSSWGRRKKLSPNTMQWLQC